MEIQATKIPEAYLCQEVCDGIRYAFYIVTSIDNPDYAEVLPCEYGVSVNGTHFVSVSDVMATVKEWKDAGLTTDQMADMCKKLSSNNSHTAASMYRCVSMFGNLTGKTELAY